MENQRFKPIYFIILFFIISAIYAIVSTRTSNEQLKKYGVIVNAMVTNIRSGRGPYEIDVTYIYKNKQYKNQFGKGNVDSLKVGTQIKALISSREPDNGPMKYLYLIN